MENLSKQIALIEAEIERLMTLNIESSDIEIGEGAERAIAFILRLKQMAQKIEDRIDNQIKTAAMNNPQKMGYEGQYIRLVISPRINYRTTGDVSSKFLKTEQVLDKDKVEKYVNATGKVPPGVTQNTTISITKKLL